MSRIALFHHSRISGGEPCILFDHAAGIVAEQILSMFNSGLTEACSKMVFGVNGGEEDAMAVAEMVPSKAEVITHPDDAKGEHPTLRAMQIWAKSNPGWLVWYMHTKGATQPGNEFWARWRHCMQGAIIDRWRDCADNLESGKAEACGCHWLTPQQYPGVVNSPFFGGNFWCCTSDFINTLPLIEASAKDRPAFYDAESLIGRGPRPPRIIDYHNEWPGGNCR